jgi:hypothetical protein
MHDPNGSNLHGQSGAFQGQGLGWRQMTIVKMSYECNCGELIEVQGTRIMDTAFVLNDLMFDHEDVTCG